MNELIGYVEIVDCDEILPEHYLNIKEQNCAGDFYIIAHFTDTVAILNAIVSNIYYGMLKGQIIL